MQNLDAITAAYLAAEDEGHALQHGEQLRAAARRLSRQLPQRDVTLFARGDAALALCAACAALRPQPTQWRRLRVGRLKQSPPSNGSVLVEPAPLSPGMRAALEHYFPHLVIVDNALPPATFRSAA